MATVNRFTTFRDPEETAAFEATKAAQAKRAAPKETRKVVVKQKVEQTQSRPADAADGDEFEETNDRRTQTQSRRGGRPATAGGDRGRGGRGRGGDRGGRGRGDMQRGGRGRGAGEREGGRRRYEGKPREDAHPMDKKSGTGRGKRDTQKGGHGKGNWGTEKAAADSAQKDVADVDDAKKEETTGAATSAAADDAAQDKVEEKKVEEFEEVVEIQDVGMTLDDFLAQKSANSKGLLDKRAGGRGHDKQVTKGIEAGENDKKRITTIDSKLTGKDTYGATAGSGAEFLGFSIKDDEDVGRGAAGRGDRERRDRGPRQQRGGAGRGRRQGKIEVNDDQFPAL